MENFNRTETIELYAGLALPGVIGTSNSLFSTPREIAERAFAIAEVMAEILEAKYKECEQLKTEGDVN
jgi:hypothetical protein